MVDHQNSTTAHEEISATSSDELYSAISDRFYLKVPMNEIMNSLRFYGLFAECIGQAKGLMKNG